MSDDAEFFAPSGCDEHGNTYYPYVPKGIVVDEGTRIQVLEPREFAEKWPRIATYQVSRTDDTTPRRLSHAEVMEFAKKRVPSVHDEDRAPEGIDGPGR